MDYDRLSVKGAKNAGRWEPLYRLARLDSNETRLNNRKLRTLLDSYGEYPAKYRLLCWRFLLQLPENHDQFALLANKETHAAFGGLGDRYPLKNQRVFKKLQVRRARRKQNGRRRDETRAPPSPLFIQRVCVLYACVRACVLCVPPP